MPGVSYGPAPGPCASEVLEARPAGNVTEPAGAKVAERMGDLRFGVHNEWPRPFATGWPIGWPLQIMPKLG